MNEEWWEKPVCVVCDYWWLFLLGLILLLGAYLTRITWVPLVSQPTLTPTIAPAPTATAMPELGTGDVQITLIWSGRNDLDLHVTDPFGDEIFFRVRSSSSGGELDVDSNAGCFDNMTDTPVENVFWPTGEAPNGRFLIEVNYFAQCTETLPTAFQVRLLVDGEVQVFTGQLTRENERILVAEFER